MHAVKYPEPDPTSRTLAPLNIKINNMKENEC